MTRIVLTAALLLFLAGALAAQPQSQQQSDKQQGQQNQQQSQQQNQSSQQSSNQQQKSGANSSDSTNQNANPADTDSDTDDTAVSHESSSRKPAAEPERKGKGSGKDAESDEPPPISTDAAKAKADATYDPFPAQQDVEVGMFYLHKGDVDAAIDRFLDAIQRRSNFAKPRLLLGKAYERKKDYESAVKYYKEYLQVLPGAPDAKDVQKKIASLSAKAQ